MANPKKANSYTKPSNQFTANRFVGVGEGPGMSRVNTFLGFTFHILGDRSEGGLAVDGSLDRTCFAFHKDAIGYAEGIAPRTEVNYIPEKTSFLVNSIFSAGAINIDDEGIVKITARES